MWVTRHWAYRILFANRRLLGALAPLCSAWCIPFYFTFSIQHYCMSIHLGFSWLVNSWFRMNSKGHIKPCFSYSGMALYARIQEQTRNNCTNGRQVLVKWSLNFIWRSRICIVSFRKEYWSLQRVPVFATEFKNLHNLWTLNVGPSYKTA